MKYLKCNRCGRNVSNKPIAEDVYLKDAHIFCDDRDECMEYLKKLWREYKDKVK